MRRKLILAIAAFILTVGTAFASPQADNTDGVLTISGKTDISKPGSGSVTLTVLKPGVTKEEFAENQDISKCFYFAEQTADADGSYSFTIPMDDTDPFGEYIIIADGGSTSYTHASQKDLKLEKAVSLIKEAPNYGTVRDVLEEYAEILGIKDEYDSDELLKVAKELYALRGSITLQNYSGVIEDAADDALKTKPGGGSTSGGGGGGGGGGGSSYIAPNMGYIGETVSAEKKFTDVPQTHWAYSYIKDLADKNIVSGKEDGSFKPSDSIKREEFSKMLAEAFLEQSREKSSGVFGDVKEGSWYEEYVYALYNNSLVSGMGDGIFGVGSEITRQDAAVMVYRCLERAGVNMKDGELAFGDGEDIAVYAQSAVSGLSEKGIINGNEEGLFLPRKSLTRAEAAKILSDALKLK